MDTKWKPENKIKNVNALKNYVVQLWNELSLRPNYCRNTVNSMHKRLTQVIERDGYWTNH